MQTNDRRFFTLALILAIVTLVAYMQVAHFGFVDFDDADYVAKNPHVLSGLSWGTVRWAFTSNEAANWHPLTWLSLAADVSMFGLRPGASHLVNLALHMVNTVLLFRLLWTMTDQMWPSVLVAALFALHPLHVESVAWISERKDVLSTLFWILATQCYVRYSRAPSLVNYLFVFIMLALGLAAKPMLVTLPLTLLLLDYWPLRRFEEAMPSLPGGSRHFARLVAEKLPLFALALGSCASTVWAQRSHGALASNAMLPPGLRVANAVHSIVHYIQKMFWPANLSVFYPHPGDALSMAKAILPLLALIFVTVMAVMARRRCPYALMGWLWYLVTLVPVLGLVQVGSQGMADRYTYIPLLGLFLAIAWGIRDVIAKWQISHWPLAIISVLSLTLLAVQTSRQVSLWRDTLTLFGHADRVTSGNWMARECLARAYFEQGRYPDAIRESERALNIAGFRANNQIRIGDSQLRLGNKSEALNAYLKALKIAPDSLQPAFQAACILVERGRIEEAMRYFQAVVRAKPGQLGADPQFVKAASLHARVSLGIILRNRGRKEEARECFEDALRIEPKDLKAGLNLGITLDELGRRSESLARFRQCLEQAPSDIGALYFFGRAAKGAGLSEEARAAFQKVLQADPSFELARRDLATLPKGKSQKALAPHGERGASPVS